MTSTRKPARKYTREDREKYALQWLYHGTIRKAAEACGIPPETALGWHKRRWWAQLVEVVRLRHKEEIEARYEHIIAKSAEQIIDRLDNGDSVLMKNGAIKKVPVKAKDLSGIMGTTQDKLRISRNQPNTISVSATLDLRELASNFARAGRTYQLTLNGRGDKDKDKLPYFGAIGQPTDNIEEAEYVEIDTTEESEDLDDQGNQIGST